MAILGLLNTESDANWRFKNIRRQVFYQYPNGKAPLTGLLSLMDEEETNDPEFFWEEKRFVPRGSTTAAHSAVGPFSDTLGNALADPAPLTAGTAYRLYIADADPFKINDVFAVRCDNNDATGTTMVRGLVTARDTTSDYLTFVALETHSAALTNRPKNGASENTSKRVLVVGSGFEQGSTGPTTEYYTIPLEPGNYTQISRTPFSLTGTAMKTSLKWDDTGPYKDKAKHHSVDHMTELERGFLFGSRYKITAGAQGLPQFFTGGLLWFLEQWEMLGSSAAIAYRGTGAAALTADTDDGKRIIENASGVLNEKTWDGYLERCFRYSNNSTSEKLALCGSGALNVLNQLWKSKSTLTTSLPSKEAYGMNVVRCVSPFGDLYFKTHPLFNEDDELRSSIFVVDINNLRYRYVSGRDTQLLKNRQNNGDDFRRDEWLSECGLEVRYPETHMFFKNITSYAP